MNIDNNHIQKNRGFTLLEALIAFLILSIGMLGIASLQAISLKTVKTSVYGSVAMMKVEELFESMRANPTALASYVGAGINNGCTGATICSPVQLAQYDVYWWKQNLKAGLPDATTTTTTVVVTAAVPPSKMATVAVTVNWKERSDVDSAGVDKSFTTTANICTQIPC